MRSEVQIKERINQLESELQDAKEWLKNATDKYYEERKTFGKDQADRGEVETAGDHCRQLQAMINTLIWALNHNII